MKEDLFSSENEISLVRRAGPGIWVCALLSFLLLVYAPLNVFLSNVSDFAFDLRDTLLYMLPVAFIAFAVASVVFIIICRFGGRLYALALSAAMAVCVSLFLQGDFFSSWLPPLDGAEVIWSDWAGKRIVSIAVWAIPLAAAVIAALKSDRQKLESLVSVAAKLMLAYLVVISLFNVFAAKNELRDKTGIRISYDHVTEMSEDENLIVLLLDCIGVADAAPVFDEYPEYSEVFRDFTYYKNAVSGYNSTDRSIPLILTGRWYLNEQPFADFLSESIPASSLMTKLNEENYRAALYDESVGYALPASFDYYENIYPAKSFTDPVSFISMFIHLAGYRYFPFDLKPFCYLEPENISFDSRKGNPEDDYFSWENEAFRDIVETEGITPVSEKCFRFIHLKGGHGAWYMDRFLEPKQGASYNDGIAGSFYMTGVFLDALKASGVYDNSAIVVLADHGGSQFGENYRSNPVLFVKGLNERHDSMIVSEAPISYLDLNEAFVSLADGATGEAVFPYREGDERLRYYYVGFDEKENLVKFEQRGYAGDMDTLIETGEKFILK